MWGSRASTAIGNLEKKIKFLKNWNSKIKDQYPDQINLNESDDNLEILKNCVVRFNSLKTQFDKGEIDAEIALRIAKTQLNHLNSQTKKDIFKKIKIYWLCV